MASLMGGDIAQAYVMRKLHKEKMKESPQQQETLVNTPTSSTNKTTSSGCFFGTMKKKVHADCTKSDETGAPTADW